MRTNIEIATCMRIAPSSLFRRVSVRVIICIPSSNRFQKLAASGGLLFRVLRVLALRGRGIDRSAAAAHLAPDTTWPQEFLGVSRKRRHFVRIERLDESGSDQHHQLRS